MRALALREQGLNNSEIANRLKCSRDAVRRAIGSNTEDENALPKSFAPRVTMKGREGAAVSCNEQIKTVDELVAATGVDLDVWEIKKAEVKAYSVGVKTGNSRRVRVRNDDGFVESKEDDYELKPKQLFYVSISIAKRLLPMRDMEALLKECTSYRHIKAHKPKKNANLLLVVSVPDLHIGKIASKRVTGHDEYNSEIAEERFRNAAEDLLTRSPKPEIGQIVFPFGNDFFNVDNHKKTTTNDTPQDEEEHWTLSFERGCKLAIWGIERAAKIAPVHAPIVWGNHDMERCHALGVVLQAHFRNDKRVTIDNEPTVRKYFEWGVTLIVWYHGDKQKPKDLLEIARVERREAVGRTKYLEAHTGDKHHDVVIEDDHGGTHRTQPSLSPPDTWHSKQGFVKSIQAAQALTYSLSRGFLALFNHRP